MGTTHTFGRIDTVNQLTPPRTTANEDSNAVDSSETWRDYSYSFEPSDYASATPCWRSQLKVQGFYCAACAGILEQALRDVPGVFGVQVDAVSARVVVSWDSGLTRPSAWLQAASKVGYALLPIGGFDALTQAKKDARTMLWRWLVAGFCMMQIMMYAWPNYTALPGDIDPLSDQLLRWASWLLALPILFFSCQPVFFWCMARFEAPPHCHGFASITWDFDHIFCEHSGCLAAY